MRTHGFLAQRVQLCLQLFVVLHQLLHVGLGASQDYREVRVHMLDYTRVRLHTGETNMGETTHG